MAAAELEIRFVGDDPEQKAAFERPQDVARQQSPTAVSAAPAHARESSASPASGDGESTLAGAMGTLNTSVGELTSTIEKLITAESSRHTQAPAADEGEPQQSRGWLAGLMRRAGSTRAGQAVVGVGRTIAARLGIGAAASAGAGAGAGAASAGAAGTAAAAGGIAAALGPVGVAAGLTAAAFGTAAISVKKLSDTVHGLADNMEDLSPAIASVRAQAEVNMELARLDRAQAIGPELAQLDAARFRIEESMYEVQTKIYELLLKGAPMLEAILDGVNVGIRGLDTAIAALDLLKAKLTIDPTDDQPAQDRLENSTREFAEAFRQVFAEDPTGMRIDPFLAEILTMNAGRNGPRGAQPPQPQFP